MDAHIDQWGAGASCDPEELNVRLALACVAWVNTAIGESGPKAQRSRRAAADACEVRHCTKCVDHVVMSSMAHTIQAYRGMETKRIDD